MDWGSLIAEDLMNVLLQIHLKYNLYYYRTNYFLMIFSSLGMGALLSGFFGTVTGFAVSIRKVWSALCFYFNFNCFSSVLHLICLCSLKTKLRNSSCLTTGDSIMVAYNNEKYYIDIVESKPAHAISIIETDCEVDFAPPLDYKEPERPTASVVSSKEPAQVQEALVEEEPKFIPFTGVGKRLDIKPMRQSSSSVTSPSPSGLKDKQPAAANCGKQQSTVRYNSQSTFRQP